MLSRSPSAQSSSGAAHWPVTLLLSWILFAPQLLSAGFTGYWRIIGHVEPEQVQTWPANLIGSYEITELLLYGAVLSYVVFRCGLTPAVNQELGQYCKRSLWKDCFALGSFALITRILVYAFHSTVLWPITSLLWENSTYYPFSPLVASRVATLPVVAALIQLWIEEAVLRSFVQETLYQLSRSTALSIIGTALLQALLYLTQGFYTACYFFVISLVCGIFYQEKRRILPIAMLHGATVLIWLLAQS